MNGDHILSPHLEGIHKVNISIVLSSRAIAMMVVGIVIYCLIKKKLVRCSKREGPVPNSRLEEGNNTG